MILSRAEYDANIASFIPDNTNRLISEQDVRDRFLEGNKSLISMVSGFDLPEYSNVGTYNEGDGVTYQNLLYRKINGSSIGIDPSDVLNWVLMPSTPFSTENKWGIVKKASLLDFNTGIDDEKYVTPLQIASLNIPRFLDDLGDVDLSTVPTEGQGLFWDSITSNFIAGDSLYIDISSASNLSFDPATRILTFLGSSTPTALDDLTDVNAASPLLGQSIFWTGTEYGLNYPVNIDLSDTLYLSFSNSTNTLSLNEENLPHRDKFEFYPDLEIVKSSEYYGQAVFEGICYDPSAFVNISFEAKLNSSPIYTSLVDISALNTWVGSNVGATDYFQVRVLADFDPLWDSKAYAILSYRLGVC